MLDERKVQLVSLILQGQSKANIAKIIGISRPTVYDWLADKEVLDEIEYQRNELVESGKEKLTSRLNTYLDELHNLATTSTDKRTKATVNMYLTDRILGKVSTNIEISNDKQDTNVNDDILERELEEFDEFDKELKIVK